MKLKVPSWVTSALKFSVLSYLGALFSILNSVLLARLFSLENFGLFQTAVFAGTLVCQLAYLGQDRGLVRDLIQTEEAEGLLFSAFSLRFVVLIFVLLMVVVAGPLFFKSNRATLLLLCLPSTAVVLAPREVFDVSRRQALHAGIVASERFAYTLSILALFLILGREGFKLLSVGAAFLIISVTSITAQWIMARELMPIRARFNLSAARLALHRNGSLWLANFGNLTLTNVIPLLLARTSPIEVGLYGLSFRLANFGRLFLSQVGRLLAPHLAEKATGTSRNEYLHRVMPVISRLAVLFFALSFITYGLGMLIIKTVLPPGYVKSIPVLRVHSAWLIIAGCGLLLSTTLIATCMNRHFLASTVMGSVVGLAAATILIPSHGAVGAAESLVAGHAVSVATMAAILWKNLNVKVLAKRKGGQ